MYELIIETLDRSGSEIAREEKIDWLSAVSRLFYCPSSWSILNEVDKVLGLVRESYCPRHRAFKLRTILDACYSDPHGNVSKSSIERYEAALKSV
jgi:hypothetical protein